MAGVYVHIPFCRQACHYCDFHFSTTLKGMDDMVDGLVQEARLRVQGSERWAGLDWSTLYLGGGTPSLLTPGQLARLMEGLATGLGLDSLQEVTLEANPEDLSKANILAWKGLGIERLSVGIQSFHDETLAWMNRAHQGEEAARGIQLAHDLGIRAISADLIYGVPTERSWQADVERAMRLPIQHLSAYSLTVEHQTVLGHRVAKGLQPEAPDERVRLEYDLLCQAMAERGWAHYETSNWAAPDGRGGHRTGPTQQRLLGRNALPRFGAWGAWVRRQDALRQRVQQSAVPASRPGWCAARGTGRVASLRPLQRGLDDRAPNRQGHSS